MLVEWANYFHKIFEIEKVNFIYIYPIGLMGGVFANGPGDQFKSYQRLLKWYLIPLCLTLGTIRYVSRVKWINPWNGVMPSPTHWCSSYWKGNLWATLDYSHQLYNILKNNETLTFNYINIIILFIYFLTHYFWKDLGTFALKKSIYG